MSSDACPGCGEVMQEAGVLGATSLAGCGGCGVVSYALCLKCAEVLRHGDQRERGELLARVELSLATDGDTAQ